jgi:hypothetical protein
VLRWIGSASTYVVHGSLKLVHGAWLIKIGTTVVSTVSKAQLAFQALYTAGTPSVTLLFSHPEAA